MSEDLRDELRRLKEELKRMKEEIKELSKEEGKKPTPGVHIDLSGVRNYVEDVVEGVMAGISGELERSVFIGPKGIRILREPEKKEEVRADPIRVASIMSSLGNEHRVRILQELVSGGKYISEIQEKLQEIATSTLSSHLDILEEAGLVVQEKVRGRYLITMPGRIALRMASQITRLVEKDFE